jgi:thiamine-phosphate diphosphorylase
MDRPILMAIVGPQGARSAGAAIDGGADLVQVRARHLSGSSLADLVRAVIVEVGDRRRVMVNSRPDIADLTGALGVHLPESGLDPRAVRAAFPDLCLGVSRHDHSGLERAVAEGADYAILGPVFETPGKEDRELGIERFKAMVNGSSLPVVAVGGLTMANAGQVIAAGARGVAAIRVFEDPGRAFAVAASFRAALDQGPRGGGRG